MKITTIFSILLLLPFLSGCWSITFKSDTPAEYINREKSIESFYGSTQEDIIMELGKPEWIEKIGGSTYFGYQWKRSDIGIVFMILPIPVAGGRVNANLYCLFLGFDEANHLTKHASASRSDQDVQPWMELDCIDIFSGATRYLTQEISIYCPKADLGQADAQKHICDLFYHGAHEIKRDLIRAYVWCSLAANGGDKVAGKQLDMLTNELSLQQLNKAQIKLDEWEPGQCEKDLFALFNIESLSTYKLLMTDIHTLRSLRLQRGAEKGDVEKQIKLYWESSTGPNNTMWLCRAADQGHPAAQSRLGLLYSYGTEGLPKDMAKALMWYRLSASNGSQDASSEITKIQQTLTTDQYTRSQELYQDWQPGLCELDIIPDNTGY